MLTDIIDLLVDVSNSFGSLISSIQVRYKNYANIINQQSPLQRDDVSNLYTHFPEIQREMAQCKIVLCYIVVDKYSVKDGRTEIRFIFLDDKLKHIHSFTLLKKNNPIENIMIPCYWFVNNKDIK